MAERWLEELYGDAKPWQLKRAYYEVVLADMTDDVDCSFSTLTTRSKTISYLAERIGEDEADRLDTLALQSAEVIGYASGARWPCDMFTVLGHHLTEHILVVSHNNMNEGESRLLVTLDCAIIRINRTHEGVIVDISTPSTDELVNTFCATAEEMWSYGEEAND
jgi:hypothetical protein